MANVKKKDRLRVFSISMHESTTQLIDIIAEKNNVSRSKVIESIVRGWFTTCFNEAKEEFLKEDKDESNIKE